MLALIDLLPLPVFFITYKVYGIYASAAATIAATGAVIAFQWFRTGTVSKTLLLTGALVAVFGGATLVLKNPVFFQWKTTIVEWLLAAVFLSSRFIGKKTLIERAMGHAIQLETAVWRELNMIWVINFFVIGAANLYVMYHYDQDTWASVKFYGTLAMTVVLLVATIAWIIVRAPHAFQDAPAPQADAEKDR